ncbi:MAG: cobalt ECF transporter T component CbiQ [Lachnospiraceae bacterium]|nr:cobalt ECF transporter T component CbiQ [Lachnospiraceae bacterium]
MNSKLSDIYSLEQLASKNTVLHRLHPGAKLLTTLIYIICVVSFDRYSLSRVMTFIVYPVVIMALGEIPFGLILKRSAVALPFVVFAGISNVIFDRNIALYLGSIPVSGGMLSLVTLVLKTVFTVSAVLILVSLTPFNKLTAELRRIHVPNLLVSLIEMIYRYITVLGEEASNMITAFRLRSNGLKWPRAKDFGSFVGQLLIRSNDRAERVYNSMICRLYNQNSFRYITQKVRIWDVVYLFIIGGGCITARAIDISKLIYGLIL